MTRLRLTCLAVLVAGVTGCGGGGGGTTDPPPGGGEVFSSVEITPSTTSMTQGETQTFTARPLNQSGGTFAGTATRAWTSDEPTIASVDATSGLVTALSPGTAHIAADVTIGSVTKRGTATVAIVPAGTAPGQATVTATTGQVFQPTPQRLARGGTITFQFQSLAHTVVFTTSGAPADIGTSANVSVDRTFNTVGTYDYHCSIHAGMEGQVIVE